MTLTPKETHILLLLLFLKTNLRVVKLRLVSIKSWHRKKLSARNSLQQQHEPFPVNFCFRRSLTVNRQTTRVPVMKASTWPLETQLTFYKVEEAYSMNCFLTESYRYFGTRKASMKAKEEALEVGSSAASLAPSKRLITPWTDSASTTDELTAFKKNKSQISIFESNQ